MFLGYLYRRLRLRWLYLCIAIVTLCVAAITVEIETNDGFNRALYSIVKDVRNRAELFANILYAYRGIYTSSDNVTDAEWDKFNNSMLVNERFSKDISITHIDKVLDSEIKEADRQKYPSRSDIDYHYIIVHSRRSAVGIDLAVSPDRLEVMNKARDTGLIQATQPIEALDNQQPIIVLYQALYNNSMPRDTIEERRAALTGFVSVLIPIKDIVPELFLLDETDDIKLKITDIESEKLVFENHSTERFNLISKTVEVDFGGRIWKVEFANYRTHYFKLSDVIMFTVIGLIGIYLVMDIFVIRFGIKEYKLLLVRGRKV